MIRRVVQMTFKAGSIDRFQSLFDEHKDQIRSYNGCQHLELWQDKQDERIFFTYSHWDSEDALNQYRHSDLFAMVWSETKVLFDDKPRAWSTELIATGSEMR